METIKERWRWAKTGIWACKLNRMMRPSLEAKGEEVLNLTTFDGDWTIEINIRKTSSEDIDRVDELYERAIHNEDERHHEYRIRAWRDEE